MTKLKSQIVWLSSLHRIAFSSYSNLAGQVHHHFPVPYILNYLLHTLYQLFKLQICPLLITLEKFCALDSAHTYIASRGTNLVMMQMDYQDLIPK